MVLMHNKILAICYAFRPTYKGMLLDSTVYILQYLKKMEVFPLILLFALFLEGNSKCITIKCASSGGVKKCSHSDLKRNEIYSVSTKKAEIPKRKYPDKWCYDSSSGFKPKNVYCPEKYYPARPCQEGEDFGFTFEQMWVDNRCGGTFNVCYYPDNIMYCTHRTLTAPANKKKTYRIDLNNKVAAMGVASKKKGRCVKGKTYNKSGKSVWVSNGCKAKFFLCVKR